MLPVTRFVTLPAFATQAQRSVTYPKGYVAAGVACGLKKKGRLDLGLLASLRPAVSAATFTSNAAAAAPVRLTRETSACDRLQGVVVNAGNANACTGRQGLPTPPACVSWRRSTCGCRSSWSPWLDRRHRRAARHGQGRAGHRRGRGGDEARRRRAFQPGDPHDRQLAEAGCVRARDRRRRGATRRRRQGLRHDLAAHGDDALLRHLRRGGRRRGLAADARGGGREELQPHHGRRSGVDQRHGRRLRQRRLGRASRRRPVSASWPRRSTRCCSPSPSAWSPTAKARPRRCDSRSSGARDAAKPSASRAPSRTRRSSRPRSSAATPTGAASCRPSARRWERARRAPAAAVTADVLYEDLAVVRGGQPAALGEGEQERLADIMAQHEIDLRVGLHGGSAGGHRLLQRPDARLRHPQRGVLD